MNGYKTSVRIFKQVYRCLTKMLRLKSFIIDSIIFEHNKFCIYLSYVERIIILLISKMLKISQKHYDSYFPIFKSRISKIFYLSNSIMNEAMQTLKL